MLQALIHFIQLLKKDLIALKAEKVTNVPISLNNLKRKVNYVDVGKLKTIPVDLKQLSDVVDNEVVLNSKFSTLKSRSK